MALLKRADWYDIARSTNWSPTYVTEDDLFPEEQSGALGLPLESWDGYDEPYKVTYREYVRTQREKDAGVYAVKAALQRANFLDTAEPGWVSILKLHYGAFAILEAMASGAESRMARFGKAGGMRNMATFGSLDENRHGQIQLYFPHEHVQRSRQFDWAAKSMHTNEWAVVAARHLFDDIMSARDAVGVAVMLTFAFETGFSNLQFLGLAADAAKAGDMVFSNLASSIQTDEARHAQIGGPVVKILIENGHKDDAQRLVDIAIWRAWTLFATVTGPSMDYYTPLERRQQSFKEFMLEWVFGQFERTLVDIGLDRPWYWDIMLDDLDTRHHGMHAGIWTFHQSVWWDVPPGVSPAEREWLEDKYPGWEETWGAHFWEPIIERFVTHGPVETVLPTMIPLCNMSQVPVTGTPGWTPGKTGRPLKDYPLEHQGRTYHFGSEVDRWIFQQDPDRYQDHLSVADRMVAGMIQPPTLDGLLAYFDLHQGEQGGDALKHSWVEAYRQARTEAA